MSKIKTMHFGKWNMDYSKACRSMYLTECAIESGEETEDSYERCRRELARLLDMIDSGVFLFKCGRCDRGCKRRGGITIKYLCEDCEDFMFENVGFDYDDYYLTRLRSRF